MKVDILNQLLENRMAMTLIVVGIEYGETAYFYSPEDFSRKDHSDKTMYVAYVDTLKNISKTPGDFKITKKQFKDLKYGQKVKAIVSSKGEQNIVEELWLNNPIAITKPKVDIE